MIDADLTTFVWFLASIITVDKGATGAILELGIFYTVYMDLLAVFSHERH